MKTCEWCLLDFDPAVSYQIYCTKECREAATRQKIAEKYHVGRRKNRQGKNRICSGGCGIAISIYNDSGFCNSCMVNKRKVEKMLKELRGLFDYEQE